MENRKKLTITCNSALNLILVCAITRVYFGIIIDAPEMMNAGWISVLLGCGLALPVYLCIGRMNQDSDSSLLAGVRSAGLRRTLAVALAFNSLMDGGISARCVSNSASYVAFNHAIRFFLLVPLFLSALWAIACNGDAIGGAARLWKLTTPGLMFIVVVIQWPQYRWTWLAPILGPGPGAILDGAVDVAGWISGFSGLLMLCQRPVSRCENKKILFLPLIIGAAAAGLVIIQRMMAPILLTANHRSRMFQLDFMLSNGRVPLILQLVLIIIWFVSLFNLMAFHCFTTAICIQQIFPKMKRMYCGGLSILLMAALSMSYLTDRISEAAFSKGQFLLNAAVVGLIMMASVKRSASHWSEKSVSY